MKFISNVTRTINLPTGRIIKLVQDHKITPGVVKTLESYGLKKYVREVEGRGNGVGYHQWTEEEIREIGSMYLLNQNLYLVRDTFLSLNPNTQHSVDSVYQTVAQFRTLDTHYPQDCSFKVTRLVETIALELSDRFCNLETARLLKQGYTMEEIVDSLSLV